MCDMPEINPGIHGWLDFEHVDMGKFVYTPQASEAITNIYPAVNMF